MRVATLVSAGIIYLAVATHAYEPPSEFWIAAVRDHTIPHELRMDVWVTQDDSCQLDETSLESMVETEMIRSRIERVSAISLTAHFIIWVTCLDTDAGYAYDIDVNLATPFDGDAGYSLLIPTFKGVTGFTQSTDNIEDAIEDAVEQVLTDFVYAHK